MSAAPLRHSQPAISTDIGATRTLYRAVESCRSSSGDTVAPDSRRRIAARIHRRFEKAVGGRHQTPSTPFKKANDV
jgi:hypothetical protein